MSWRKDHAKFKMAAIFTWSKLNFYSCWFIIDTGRPWTRIGHHARPPLSILIRSFLGMLLAMLRRITLRRDMGLEFKLTYRIIFELTTLHLSIRVTGKMKPLIYIMWLYFKALLQQMWSKLSDELDVLDDHTQIASRAGEGTRRTTRINMKYRIYSPGEGGGASIRIAPEITWWCALIRVVFQIVI